MRVILAISLAVLAAIGLWLWFGGQYAEVMRWAVAEQRAFQNELAQFIMAARRGEPGVVWGLIGASALYGFVHVCSFTCLDEATADYLCALRAAFRIVVDELIINACTVYVHWT